MKPVYKFLFPQFLILFTFAPNLARANSNGIPTSTLEVIAFAWESTCLDETPNEARSCTPPRPFPGGTEELLQIPVAPVSSEGQANRSKQLFKLNELTFEWSVFSVFPRESSGQPPYLQLRIELVAPIRANCIQSVRYRETFEAPPLICSGYIGNRHIGVTLRNWKLKL